MKIIIVGGGVGGLAAAVGLLRLGIDVTVLERADAIRTAGAGLNIWPNGGRALAALGLKQAYDDIAVKLMKYIYYSSAGVLLRTIDTSDWGDRFGAYATGLHRKALNEMLADAVGYQNIRFGTEITNVKQEGDKVYCMTDDGGTLPADAVIGADGVYSRVRTSLVGDIPLRENEFHAFRCRAIFDLNTTSLARDAQTGLYDEGGFVSVIPIGKGLAYWFGSVNGARSFDEFSRTVSTWRGPEIPEIVTSTSKDMILENYLQDFGGIPFRWTHGRVTLMGDAAHAVMPDLAQGATQTLVDAAALQAAFTETLNPLIAFQRYESRRRPTADHIVAASARGSFMGGRRVSPIAERYVNDVESFQG
jgi:2-polyprenyl-6-methoxyphenol hydroxylase-like FAD-dependent oxidoreductase